MSKLTDTLGRAAEWLREHPEVVDAAVVIAAAYVEKRERDAQASLPAPEMPRVRIEEVKE